MVLPLNQRNFHRIGVVQRKMLRSIVGWVRVADEPWEDTMRRMRQRLERAMRIHYVEPWEVQILRRQWSYAQHVAHNDRTLWSSLVLNWQPHLQHDLLINKHFPYRAPGRPRTRWDDNLMSFCQQEFEHDHWLQIRSLTPAELHHLEDAYVVHCM